MNTQIKDFNDLISKSGHYLLYQLFYSPKTVSQYRGVWKRIRAYMASNGIKYYDQNVEKQIFEKEFKGRNIRELSTQERIFYNGAKMLSEFQETGKINIPALPRKEPLVFNGAIGEIITNFLYYKKTEEKLSINSLNFYQRNLFQFLSYCNKKEIHSLKDINLSDILLFIGEQNPPPAYHVISALRGFLQYAYMQKLFPVDYSKKIPKCKLINQPKIPSIYSIEEIEKLLLSVGRHSSMGKRNYAIILIAVRLGLRASDISRLKFENLHWDNSTIEIEQYKTGKELMLPLLPDVGNAIIDYLKYGRPKSEEPQVFLMGRPPYGHFLTSNVVTHVVQRAFKNAGIDINGRRFGTHSLRHTLGFRMLEKSTVLPVISEVFGHENTKSTRYYLRVDLKSMRQCMLDVSPVAVDFYEQEGGAFYE